MNILLAYVSKLSKPTEVMPPYETFLSNAAILDVILQNSTPSTACNENRLRPGGMTSHGLLRLASGMAFVFTGNARQLRRPCACWRFCCFFFLLRKSGICIFEKRLYVALEMREWLPPSQTPRHAMLVTGEECNSRQSSSRVGPRHFCLFVLVLVSHWSDAMRQFCFLRGKKKTSY